MKIKLLSILFCIALVACKNDKKEQKQSISDPVAEKETKKEKQTSVEITPIEHATFSMTANGKTIYVDPVGNLARFNNLKDPDLILVTDIHGDHLDVEALTLLTENNPNCKIVCPKAVKEKLPETLHEKLIVMNNGESKSWKWLDLKAIPMYNLREEAKEMHVKGRGNGYVLNWNNQKIYISGDTEDIPEMRNLKNIDIAFVCMNLPYTMPVDSAADAVLDFKPKKVYPYHYRGKDGLSDVDHFKNIVTTNNDKIEVELLKWYPNS